MNNNEDVGNSDEPPGMLQTDEDVVGDRVAEDVISQKGDREVADEDSDVGPDHSLPHGTLGRLVRRRRDGGLDLQSDAVSGVCKRYVPQ